MAGSSRGFSSLSPLCRRGLVPSRRLPSSALPRPRRSVRGLAAAAVVYLGAQTIWPALFSVRRVVIAAIAPVLATLFEKTLFIVEGLENPAFDIYKALPGHYFPTWVEI